MTLVFVLRNFLLWRCFLYLRKIDITLVNSTLLSLLEYIILKVSFFALILVSLWFESLNGILFWFMVNRWWIVQTMCFTLKHCGLLLVIVVTAYLCGIFRLWFVNKKCILPTLPLHHLCSRHSIQLWGFFYTDFLANTLFVLVYI